MKAAVHTRFGPPDVVQISDVPRPVPADNEVLVRVHASTVNRTDCGFRAGKPWFGRLFYGLVRPRATTLGSEFAGVVESLGRDVTAFQVGDRVFGYNDRTFGGHAEYLATPEDSWIAAVPANLTFEEAAPSTEGAHYALGLLRAANIQAGHAVLIYGATGAIGSAAVQLAKSLGASVTAVCATAHLELVKGLGADRVVDYTAQDFTRDEQRYDIVFDAVGKSSFGRCKQLMKPRGVFIATDLGPLSQNPFLALITRLGRGRQVRFPLPRNEPEMVRYLKELIESGQFKPIIDRRYPLDEIVEAYRYVDTGQKLGNVVISVVPSS
ncbi:MAG: NAD(P)-dependent alcohol dehydrogenase [Actinomycetes bacterium]|jgi:NADPH:quinone reductase-like Zn-dependent oxidoreductase|nr:NAD(P)-dependent alcohol dehydrogenase [Actinomycetes bacterium]